MVGVKVVAWGGGAGVRRGWSRLSKWNPGLRRCQTWRWEEGAGGEDGN